MCIDSNEHFFFEKSGEEDAKAEDIDLDGKIHIFLVQKNYIIS